MTGLNESSVQDFTVHMVFSAQGADACATYIRAHDRVAVMFKINLAALAHLRSRAARACVVSACDSPLAAADEIAEALDYTTLVRWCADAARVVSWR